MGNHFAARSFAQSLDLVGPDPVEAEVIGRAVQRGDEPRETVGQRAVEIEEARV